MIKVENNIVTVEGVSIQFDSAEKVNSFLLDYITKNGMVFVNEVPKVENSTLNRLIEEYGDIEIENLDLSVRAYNCLKRAGINTIEQIIKLDYEDVCRIRNLGWRSIIEVGNITNEFIRVDYIDWASQRNTVDVV